MPHEQSSVPQGSPDATPREMSASSGEARALSNRFSALEERVSNLIEHNKAVNIKVDALVGLTAKVDDLKVDISTLKGEGPSNFTKLLRWGGGAVIFVLLALTAGYLRLEDKIEASSAKVEDHINSTNLTMTKATTQLEDLLARIPPVQSSPRR